MIKVKPSFPLEQIVKFACSKKADGGRGNQEKATFVMHTIS